MIATGNIESWLQALVDGMQDSVKSIIRKAHDEVQTQQLEEFIFGHPAQISLLGIQFMWTNDMQSALTIAKQSKEAMREAFKKPTHVFDNIGCIPSMAAEIIASSCSI